MSQTFLIKSHSSSNSEILLIFIMDACEEEKKSYFLHNFFSAITIIIQKFAILSITS